MRNGTGADAPCRVSPPEACTTCAQMAVERKLNNDVDNEENHNEVKNLDEEQNLGVCLGCPCSLRQLD